LVRQREGENHWEGYHGSCFFTIRGVFFSLRRRRKKGNELNSFHREKKGKGVWIYCFLPRSLMSHLGRCRCLLGKRGPMLRIRLKKAGKGGKHPSALEGRVVIVFGKRKSPGPSLKREMKDSNGIQG